MTALLSIEGLQVSYGTVEALKGVTLELNEGEIVTVLGANGAGKSTLLKTVSRLIPSEKGQMRFAGRFFERLAAYEVVRMGISHCPEGRKVFATLTVEENLNLGAYTRRRQKADLKQEKERVFDLFPILRKRRRQLSGTLSGGEQQMLAVARALMGMPVILMLDELSSGLAPFIVKELFGIIRQLNKDKGVTIFLVEQNIREALSLSDFGYVLENGRIVLEGTGWELLNNEQTKKAYIGG